MTHTIVKRNILYNKEYSLDKHILSKSSIFMMALSLSFIDFELLINRVLSQCLLATMTYLRTRSYCHNHENIRSPPWLDCQKQSLYFTIAEILQIALFESF